MIFATFGAFLQYMASSIFMLVSAIYIYTKITPYNEIKLIREGNTAAAVAFAGTILGMVVAMSSVIVHSTGWLDKIAWCGISLIVQLLVWGVVNLIFKNLQTSIDQDRCMADAVMLATFSLAAGILQAACVSW